jgi:hypothetical protein
VYPPTGAHSLENDSIPVTDFGYGDHFFGAPGQDHGSGGDIRPDTFLGTERLVHIRSYDRRIIGYILLANDALEQLVDVFRKGHQYLPFSLIAVKVTV